MTNSSTDDIQKILKASLGELSGGQCALMFSGGFDSMLMALLAQRCGARVTAVMVCFDDFNPITVAEATSLAQKMGLAQHILHVTLPEFLSAFKSLPSLTDRPISDLDLVLIHAAFKKYDSKIAGKIFVSGMGSDQWFGDRAFEQDAMDEGAHHQLAKIHEYRFIFPFLSNEVKVLSQQLPAFAKKDKKLLRDMVSDEYKRLIPKRSGDREIQVPIEVRRLLVRIYSGEKNVKADDKAIRQVIEHLWVKKNRNRYDETH